MVHTTGPFASDATVQLCSPRIGSGSVSEPDDFSLSCLRRVPVTSHGVDWICPLA
jgi:hypothetical protein